MNPRQRLLRLLQTHAYARRQVVLSSGKTSDFFIDCKRAVLSAEGHALAGELLFDAALACGPVEAVAGVELGGCPLASATALTSFVRGSPLDAIYVRKRAKEHGSQSELEGASHVRAGASVVVLEDVVTTGGSTLRAVETLRRHGFKVDHVIALVDRLEGGRDALSQAGLTFASLFSRTDFVDAATALDPR